MKRMRYGHEFERALPRIQLHAKVYFRDVVCPHRKADLLAEAVGLSFQWWLRLRKRGKNCSRSRPHSRPRPGFP